MPTAQDFADFKEAYERLSPHPEQFDAFLMSLSGMDSDFAGWTDEQLAGIRCPVLIVQGDTDFTTIAHAGRDAGQDPGLHAGRDPGDDRTCR